MTHPTIVQVPGAGQDVQQALAPLIQVLQQRHQMQLQQQEHEQTVAAHLFAEGLNTPGFESSDAALQLEQRLGVPGLGKSIAQARVAEGKRQMADIATYVNESGFDPTTKSALLASLTAKVKGATVDMQNTIFQAFVGGGSVAALEKARLDHLQAETRKLNLDIEGTPTPDDQRKAASVIGVKPESFVDHFPYVEVLASIMKARAADSSQNDPMRAIINASLRVMTDLHDQFGHPSLTPPEATDIVLQTFRPMFPDVVQQFQLSPSHNQELLAAKAARIAWQNAADANYVKKDAAGKVVRRYGSRAEYRETLMASLHATYPLITDNNLRTLMDIVETSVFTPRIFGAPEPR